MAEYIGREDTLKELNKNSITKKITLADGVCIFDAIKNIPAADVVEVVRCKDCKHFVIKPNYRLCSHNFNRIFKSPLEVSSNHFCSYGEKKEGAEE